MTKAASSTLRGKLREKLILSPNYRILARLHLKSRLLINIPFNDDCVIRTHGDWCMDGDIEDGNAFVIPDLWKTSTLAHFDRGSIDHLILDLEPLSM